MVIQGQCDRLVNFGEKLLQYLSQEIIAGEQINIRILPTTVEPLTRFFESSNISG
jgi:hypothetical protein